MSLAAFIKRLADCGASSHGMRCSLASGGGWLAVFCLIVADSTTCRACKYNVRDSGFVDFAPAPYRLSITYPTSLAGAEDWVRGGAAAALSESNVELETSTNRPAGGDDRWSAVLVDEGGASFDLSPVFQKVRTDADCWAAFDRVVRSPARMQLQRGLAGSFAVALVIRGKDEVMNQHVERAVEEAFGLFDQEKARLPKVPAAPPVLQRIELADRGAERLLLWSLGVEPSAAVPALVLVYGRMRLSGKPMAGPLVTATELLHRLLILGQDCECDLDRVWLKGRLLPASWPMDTRRQVVRSLGFDPDNPLVRGEVARIVLKNDGEGLRRATRASSAEKVGEAYSEVPVEDNGVAAAVGDAPDGTIPAGEAGKTTTKPKSPGAGGGAQGAQAVAVGSGATWMTFGLLGLVVAIGGMVLWHRRTHNR